ncbi:hypothetical protein BJF83_07725 [Nocardiopsis sp. CNR-923]|uniref:hypothetical protein n=1 Tax=Nocardiopsis sp. CNR-923 TaxID=1904965 RepID=UPI00095D4455|nr:hypothetical protein [Nocardiopsis sp. CNR-923]OLT30604.1 hypothetical protein BJF83_07725 [Nocardiopsis sp. CNR-923]
MPHHPDVTDRAVRALIEAINANDREAFAEALTPDATMSDDGSERDLFPWAEKEIFASNGRMDVVSASEEGRSLIADYRNDAWGAMRTRWDFTIVNGKVSRIDTGHA